MQKEITNIQTYLKAVNKQYARKSGNINDVLNNFRLLSPEYQKFTETPAADQVSYSNINFLKCSDSEKLIFASKVSFESVVCNSIYDKHGLMYTWIEVFDLMQDPIYKTVEKIKRKVIFSSNTAYRPIGDSAFDSWNGLQIIDLDIKDEKIADGLKPIIFNELSRYNWFLGICKSASGKSLHVWTKITPISTERENLRVEYLCNFRHKYSYVYIILTKYAKQFGYSEDKIEEFMDMAMAKPQQGIFITSDDAPLMSTNFKDLRLDVNFEPAFNLGVESIDWIAHPNLKAIFSKLEWFNNEAFDSKVNVELTDVSNINDRDITKSVRKHYKHLQRWQLANTLTNIYGFEKALQYMVEICENTPFKELRGDVKTAEIHNKPITIWAVKQLNKFHGFKIKINNAQDLFAEQRKTMEEVINERYETKQEETTTETNKNKVVFNIKHNQYLSHIKDDIVANLGHITLLEAGAGYGKTEMIKALKDKTCLILPFTSTIKSKIEKSEVTEDWLYYYGNKRPTLEELLGNHNMSMTIDKFSRLNVMELDQADFKYIVLDESHLLFTSSYRDVMAPTIQRLANCKAQVILMTGTPTGELVFFPNIKHIKVIKEDNRVKTFDVHYCYAKEEQQLEMCKSMAEDIKNGIKILFPTNNGNIFFEQMSGVIQEILDRDNFGRQINRFYYKKSNYGDDSMDNINYDKTIGNNDIIFCTTYLSVGVDICDRYKFSVYFDEPWIPQDIEQFANRLRNNDLYVKLFLPTVDSAFYPINYTFTRPLYLDFNQEDLMLARDLIRTCNDMIERNNDEAKSNPLIQSLIIANRYLKYDENACKYYIDETMYKLKVFEDRYAAFKKQLPELLSGLAEFGYVIDTVDHTAQMSDLDRVDFNSKLRSCRHKIYDETTNQVFKLISQITDNNIDIYREILKGNLDILRGKDENNLRIREDNAIYAENIEVVEKNIPIILSLYKYYNIETINSIYRYCVDQKTNRINFSKLEKIKKFISIVNSIKKSRLDLPIYRFVIDSKKFAVENPITTKDTIDNFITQYAVKIANNVKDLVVEDVIYLKMVNEKLTNLFKVLIDQSRPIKGEIKLSPFELIWETKDIFDKDYGGISTKTFFLQELVDDMKTDEQIEIEQKFGYIDETVTLEELEHTSKLTLADKNVQDEIMNTVDKSYSYEDYSNRDGSNDRFMDKQHRTYQQNQNLRIDTEDIKPIITNDDLSLF